MTKHSIITGVVALIVGLGAGYWGATAFAKPTPSFGRNLSQGGAGGVMFTRGGAGAQAGGGFVSGTVAQASATSITVNTRDGNSHVVLMSPSTTVAKSVTGSLSDLSAGSDVIVSGTTNSDGSITATLIQIRPAGANAPMMPAAGG
ncbi:hypothetical protein KGQ55_00540 [Patescibacteria group bacterium]|nr:hypothetical protein [Patescibacteria group bacterium]